MYFFTFAISAIALLLTLDTVTADTFGATINFYHGTTVDTFSSYDLAIAEDVSQHAKFNFSRPIVLFIHGVAQSPYTQESQLLVQAYITNGRYNILLMNWQQAASGFLGDIVSRVDSLGSEVAGFIFRITKWDGFPLAQIHVVGHSMGSHVAGAAGKYIKLWSNNLESIDRITGLDPASASAYGDILNWQKARFNDNVHTDNGLFGLGAVPNTGHADFLVNGGAAFQPGCTFFQIACSHFRAIVCWAESVLRKDHVSFLSTKNDNPNIKIQMGNNCPTFGIPSGVYLVDTNNSTWYSKS